MDIESQPAVAGDSIKPGVKRSGTPGDCPKIMPARGAGDSGYHDFRAVARSAGCGPWMCCSWGSATLHPRLYAIARYRGLAWISSPNDFLCKAPRHSADGGIASSLVGELTERQSLSAHRAAEPQTAGLLSFVRAAWTVNQQTDSSLLPSVDLTACPQFEL